MKITSKLFLILSTILCILSSFEGIISCGDHPDNGENYSAAKSTVRLSQVIPLDLATEIPPIPAPLREKPVVPTMSRNLEPNDKGAAAVPSQSPAAARAPDPTLPRITFRIPTTFTEKEATFFEGLRKRNTDFVLSRQKINMMQQESKKDK